MKKIAIIGSRKAPYQILQLINAIGWMYAKDGYLLRSGDAIGVDKEGAIGFSPEMKELYISDPKETDQSHISWYNLSDQAKIKSVYHASSVCEDFWQRHISHQLLFARNSCQILGRELDDPVDKVIYYAAQNGNIISGGTRIAVYIAKKYGIECENLYHNEVFNKYRYLLNKPKLTDIFGDIYE